MELKCKQCGEDDQNEFYASNKSRCKTCIREGVKSNREANADYYKQYDKARDQDPDRIEMKKRYAKTEAGIVSGNKAKRKWQENNLIKRAVHVQTGNAIRDGLLIKEPCECCDEQIVHAHHDDYAKPLEVRWLCSKCHEKWHDENGEALNP